MVFMRPVNDVSTLPRLVLGSCPKSHALIIPSNIVRMFQTVAIRPIELIITQFERVSESARVSNTHKMVFNSFYAQEVTIYAYM